MLYKKIIQDFGKKDQNKFKNTLIKIIKDQQIIIKINKFKYQVNG